MAGLGLIIAGCRRCTRACLVAGGTVKLRLTGRSTIWPGVFTLLLLLLLLALVARVDLLRRVLAVCWVQPEPLLRLGNTVVVHLRSEGAGVGVVSDRRSPPDDSRLRRLQLLVGLLPPGGQLVQTQLGIPGLGELQPRLAPDRAAEAFQASNRPTATSSQSAVRLGVRGITSPGQRAANTCAPTR